MPDTDPLPDVPDLSRIGPVHVIGANGRSGLALVRALLDRGAAVVPVVRSAERWHAAGIRISPRVADIEDGPALAVALAGAGRVVSTAHARHAGAILAAGPADAGFVFLGSTRKFTRWPDEHGNGVLAGERAFQASGRRGVMLHPTMIYGAEGENNVQRLADVLRRLPVVPLPGGGRALVQPIHQSDVTAAMLAALGRDWDGPHGLVIAGPDILAYRDFVAGIADAAGLPRRRIIPVPAWPLMLGALLAGPIPRLPSIGAAEIRRLMEDKAFDIAQMREILRLDPISLAAGLARTFAH
ncbi:NAD(P)H-binding protein [Lichenicola cladoniae]|uniref:NAD(P)H-binding protein n=1 Tax=Lichenicola cladoniae TaxID=1484109 RepID=A0A6M8HP89_9PROT|nr:NAD(P)H-binding protein [Lichenicola cladoniae]NPD68414.1 NAD(P)H-binding protein [Acetobacteraceae bacterium]QKE90100.1 NAD(P)H-binding protein [Lichenicola cladoniae]